MASKWVEHVKAFYQKKKKSNPSYKYSQAMKDAKATYKKVGATATKKSKKTTRKSKKNEEEEEKVGGSMAKKRVARKKKVKILKM